MRKRKRNSPITVAFQNFEGLQVSLYNQKMMLSMVKMVTFAISNKSDDTSGENSNYHGIDELRQSMEQ